MKVEKFLPNQSPPPPSPRGNWAQSTPFPLPRGNRALGKPWRICICQMCAWVIKVLLVPGILHAATWRKLEPGNYKWITVSSEKGGKKFNQNESQVLINMVTVWILVFLNLFISSTYNKHGNSVTNSISSFWIILWFNTVIPTEKAVIHKMFVCYVHRV